MTPEQLASALDKIVAREGQYDNLDADELAFIQLAAAALRERDKDAERYRWLADKVIAPDYGDNPWRAEGKGKGYWIRRRKGPEWIEGDTLDAAIDAALPPARWTLK